MIKKFLILALVIGIGYLFYGLFSAYQEPTSLSNLGSYYASHGAEEVGAANLVSAIVVTYRGLDTLGEVTILFLTAAIIGFILKLSKENTSNREPKAASEIFISASQVIVPVIFLVGIYIFLNGHLTPGGGFQGGAVMASGVLLMLLADRNMHISHKLVAIVESISGIVFVLIGISGIAFASGFLDNRLLPLGTFGTLLSAGVIPLIYIFIGLKVGAELSNIVGTLSVHQNEKTN